jgi:hypothetical protein
MAIAVGALLDGIPESMVIGLSLIGGGAVSVVAVIAIFGLWSAITVISGVAALIGYAAFRGLSGDEESRHSDETGPVTGVLRLEYSRRTVELAGMKKAGRSRASLSFSRSSGHKRPCARVDDRGRPRAHAGWQKTDRGSSIRIGGGRERMTRNRSRKQLALTFLWCPPRLSLAVNRSRILLPLLILLCAAGTGWTQTYVRSVRGTVTGPDGKPIRAARSCRSQI